MRMKGEEVLGNLVAFVEYRKGLVATTLLDRSVQY